MDVSRSDKRLESACMTMEHCSSPLRWVLWLLLLFGYQLVEGLSLKSLSPTRRLLDSPFLARYWRVAGPFSSKLLFSDITNQDDDSNLSVEEAQKLRQRAKELMAEARALERALEESRSRKRRNKGTEWQSMLDRLFLNRPLTPESAAAIMRQERWSVDQVMTVLEGLYERRKRAMAIPAGQEFQIAAVTNVASANETDAELTDQYVMALMEAAAILDEEVSNPADRRNMRWSGRGSSALKARWNDMRKRDEKDLERRLRTMTETTNATLQDYMRRTLGLPVVGDNPREFNITRVMERAAMVPYWVPSSLLSYLVAARAQVQSEDVKAIKERVLVGTGFFCTQAESIPSAAVFRGNIRGTVGSENVTAVVFEEILNRMQQEGLSARLQVFFLQDPEWKPGGEDAQPRPVLLAVSKLVDPDDRLLEQSVIKTVVKRASVGLTVLATFAFSVTCYALNPSFFDRVVNQSDATPLWNCVPLTVGVFVVQAVHEAAHILMARLHKIKIGLPVPVPSAQIGLFGCITPIFSFPKNRRALLDFALSGPITGFLLSLLLMVVGSMQTVRASEAALASFPYIPVSILKSSFVSGSIITFLSPKTITLPLSMPVPVSPLFLVGMVGSISNALNLLPIFRLDGGRACTAAMGNRFAAFASASSLLLILSSVVLEMSSIGIAWALLIVLFQRRPEIPLRDEVTDIDDGRRVVWLASLIASLLVLLPYPGGQGVL